jgi:hypothetical protein
LLGLTLVTATSAGAEALRPVVYDTLANRLDGVITFETVPAGAEPGTMLDHPLKLRGAVVAAGFAGQRRATRHARNGERYDQLDDARAHAPLRPVGHGHGKGLAFAYHRGFGSTAVFPLGPDGFDALSGRGEGTLAVLFAQDQAALGLRIHSDYPDPLGARQAKRGAVRLYALARDGGVIGQHAARLTPGITELGIERPEGQTDIAGFILENTDPGGIAVDDILFMRSTLLGGLLTGRGTVRRMSWQRGKRAR